MPSNACFSIRGPRKRFKWGILALLAAMGFWTTVDFVAKICLTIDLGLVTPPHGGADVFAAPSNIIATTPLPSVFVFIAHIMNVSTAHVTVPCHL
jgi:hypothetical protein